MQYCFYMARTVWALSLLGIDAEGYELSASSYVYEVMRLSTTISVNPGILIDESNLYLACETLGIGLLPILHLIGQSCPKPTWLQWIVMQLNHAGQEGLFSGKILSKSINTLHTFKICNNINSLPMLD